MRVKLRFISFHGSENFLISLAFFRLYITEEIRQRMSGGGVRLRVEEIDENKID